jgi:hypothetical protein
MALVVGESRGTRQRTTQRILGLVFYFCGLVFAGRGLMNDLRARTQSADSREWASVSGQITRSTSQTSTFRRNRTTCTWADICFRYTVAGIAHTSCRATFLKSCSASTAAGLLVQFPAGAGVTVFYAPAAPDEAVLVPGSWRGQAMLRNWLLLMVLFGALAAYVGWCLLRPPEDDAAIGDPSDGPAQV